MFIRTRRVNGREYHQLLESYRGEDGKPKHRVHASWTGHDTNQTTIMKNQELKKETLNCTRDYSLFENHPHNRDIRNTNRLEASMRKFGFDSGLPIRCVMLKNGKLQITHGHHRFYVAQMLGLPVWFVIATKEIPLFESEASGPGSWSLMDFVFARANAGDKACQEILKYREETGIPIQSCISILGGESAGSHNKAEQVKAGRFHSSKVSQKREIARVMNRCKEISLKIPNIGQFVNALSKCLRVENFDVDTFLHRLTSHKCAFEPCRTADEYIGLIEEIYNRKCSNKVSIAFEARNIAKSRQDTFGESSGLPA